MGTPLDSSELEELSVSSVFSSQGAEVVEDDTKDDREELSYISVVD